MNIAVLTLAFLAAVAVAGSVVLAFAVPIDGVLRLLLSGEMEAAWSRYAKFALFVAAFTGGLRLKDLEIFSSPAPQSAITGGQCLIEVFKTIGGALGASSELLLAFFAATLAAYAGRIVYESLKSPSRSQRVDEHRQPVAGGRF